MNCGLRFMYLSQRRPVTPRTIFSDTWGYSFATETHTDQTHIYRLRRKLEPPQPSFDLNSFSEDGYLLTV